MSIIDNFLIVDQSNSLDERWIPRNLVIDPVSGIWIAKEVYEAFYMLNKNLQQQGRAPLVIVSGYRSYAMQKKIYQNTLFISSRKLSDENIPLENWCERYNQPGQSEHQLGIVIDIMPEQYRKWSGRDLQTFSVIDTSWIQEYVRNYGFILTDEKEKPWHYRYVGVGHAKKMKRLGLTFKAYVQYINQKNTI